jgi:hypothetical protein
MNIIASLLLFSLFSIHFAPRSAQQTNSPSQTQPAPPPKKPAPKPIDPDETAGVRGLGLPVVITVRVHGKPAPDAFVVVKTDAGIELKSGQTDTAGVFKLKLEPGDYIINAVAGEHHRQLAYTLEAKPNSTPVTIILAL